jgi:Kef-type K+ transport system membrane component KefB
MEGLNIINLLLVLIAAWLGGAIANKLNYPAILGELIIGIILGPSLLGIIHESSSVSVLANLGILLLMTYIGMQIDFRDLKKASWSGVLAAIGSLVVPFFMMYYILLLFGVSNMVSLFVATAVGVTALATKSRILVDLKLLNTRIAYVMLAGALVSDTLALILFAGIINFADVGQVIPSELLIVIGKAILFFIVATLIGYFLLPRIGQYFDRLKIQNRTLHFTMMLVITFSYAAMAEFAGLHSLLGAFIAGMFIRDGFFNQKVSREVFKIFYDISIGFLAPIFFVSAGFSVNLRIFQTDWQLLLLVLSVAIIGRIAGVTLFYLISGKNWREGFTVGAGMNGRGAVGIIVADVGFRMGIISNEMFSILLVMAFFTTVTVPVSLKWCTDWLRKRDELVQIEKRKGYLILGVNPLSLFIARKLKEKAPVYFLDSNNDSVKIAKNEGFECTYGNALKEEVMAEANAASVNSFIAITGNSEINLLAGQLAHDTFLVPQKIILVSPGNKGADIDNLYPIGASTLFAMKTHLDEWIRKMSSGDFVEEKECVSEKWKPRRWLKSRQFEYEKILPLLIESNEKVLRPFQYNDEIKEGETIIYLR